MHFEPLHLRAFTALMNEGSVSKASLELRTSPSNVRRIWQSLEEQLGEKLFVPNEIGETSPTTAARALDREMNRLLEEVRRFEASVKRIHQNGLYAAPGSRPERIQHKSFRSFIQLAET